MCGAKLPVLPWQMSFNQCECVCALACVDRTGDIVRIDVPVMCIYSYVLFYFLVVLSLPSVTLSLSLSLRIQRRDCRVQKHQFHSLGCRWTGQDQTFVEALFPKYTRFVLCLVCVCKEACTSLPDHTCLDGGHYLENTHFACLLSTYVASYKHKLVCSWLKFFLSHVQ